MLAALLPLLEALGAEGGAAAAFGGGATAARGGAAMAGGGGGGGFGAALGRVLSGPQAFSSETELGAAVRKMSDLSAGIRASQEAMEKKSQESEGISRQARQQEQQFAFSDPSHREQLADLAKQQAEHAEEIRRSERERRDLNYRAAVSTDPAAARSASNARASAIIGLGTAAATMAPGMLGQLARDNPISTAGRAAYTAAEGVGAVDQTQGNIIKGAGEFAGGFADIPRKVMTNPFTSVTGEFIMQLSKAPGLIKSWGESLVESQRTISRFNPLLAQTFAKQEHRGLVRGIESGQRTSGATSDLSDSLQNLADSIQPMRDVIHNVLARGLTTGVQLLTRGVKVLENIFEAVKKLDPTGKIDGIMKAMEETNRVQAMIAMKPLGDALKNLERRDKSKPKEVPRR